MKVEGNHAPNDFSRELARRALHEVLAHHRLAERALTLLAIGCEGVATPLAYVIADLDDDAPSLRELRLAIGLATSAPIPATQRGTTGLVESVAATVAAALRDAKLAATEVGLVLVKVPTAPVGAVDTTPKHASMRRGRSIAALGTGIALDEIAPDRVTDEMIGRDDMLDYLYARRAMTFAGPELDRVEVVALGNRPGVGGDLVVASTLLSDILDAPAIRRMLTANDVTLTDGGALADPAVVPALLLKAGIAPDGRVRGARTIAYSSALPPESHMRAAASGVLGSILGHTRFFISGDPIHHAPRGGGIAAALIRKRR
jgi:cyanuric acid amidohydrolase